MTFPLKVVAISFTGRPEGPWVQQLVDANGLLIEPHEIARLANKAHEIEESEPSKGTP